MFKLDGVESDLSLFAAETHYSLCPAFRLTTNETGGNFTREAEWGDQSTNLLTTCQLTSGLTF